MIITLNNSPEAMQDKGFQLQHGILYKVGRSFGQSYLRLCLPQEVCKDVIHKMHNLHNMHFSANTTQVIYSANLYTRNENEIIKRMCNSCSVCFLYSPKYTRKYSGIHRTFETNLNVGEVLYADIAYLHRDSDNNKFAILTDRLTSYTVAYALKDTTMKSTAPCIEEYLRHLLAREYFCSD